MNEGRCKSCESIVNCPKCNAKVEKFHHYGVRSSFLAGSSIWHYAIPCGDRVVIEAPAVLVPPGGNLAVYNGGPIWQDGYSWFNIFWGAFWKVNSWVDKLNAAVKDIEEDPSYSGMLKQYNVGQGKLSGHAVIEAAPPSTVSSKDIGTALSQWISSGKIPDLGTKGAYNVFLPPGITATLSADKSCSVFCDYHDTVNGNNGPFFTCEPYPCASGCNQCDSSPFDTLSQGLSEEMVELKTDMNPGTGWVIGNEEVCDYCDRHFVCNRISTGEYVNAWYDNAAGKCWSPSL